MLCVGLADGQIHLLDSLSLLPVADSTIFKFESMCVC